MPKAVEIVQLAGRLELDRQAAMESDSDREEEGQETFQEHNVAQRDGVLVGLEMLCEIQKGNPDWQSLAQWWHGRASTTTGDELQASSPYIGV